VTQRVGTYGTDDVLDKVILGTESEASRDCMRPGCRELSGCAVGAVSVLTFLEVAARK
jgi:hypothetical protein